MFWQYRCALEAARRKVSQAHEYVETGNSLFDQGDFASAIDKYERALALIPDLKTAEENIQFARRMMDPGAWLEENPGDVHARSQLFLQLIRASEWAQARECALASPSAVERDRWLKLVDRMEDEQSQGRLSSLLTPSPVDMSRNALMRVLSLFYVKEGRWPESDDEMMRYANSVRDGESLSHVSCVKVDELQDHRVKVFYVLNSESHGRTTNTIFLSRGDRGRSSK